jgi:hypothetical protein
MREKTTHDEATRETEGPPPVGGSWRVLYSVVLLNLAALILLFYLFTRAFG